MPCSHYTVVINTGKLLKNKQSCQVRSFSFGKTFPWQKSCRLLLTNRLLMKTDLSAFSSVPTKCVSKCLDSPGTLPFVSITALLNFFPHFVVPLIQLGNLLATLICTINIVSKQVRLQDNTYSLVNRHTQFFCKIFWEIGCQERELSTDKTIKLVPRSPPRLTP